MCKKFTSLLVLIFFSFCSMTVWAWNDRITHGDLSEKATKYSVLSLSRGDCLNNVGLSKNIEEKFSLNGEVKSVKEWIREGGIKDDAGNIFTAYY